MECTKIMLQAREFSAGAKIRVCILKKKKWSVKNEEHQEQDIDVFCGSKLTSVLAKILKCIFESQQPARSGSCPHFSCREADPGKNTSSHKFISALRRELFISPTGCIQKEKRRLATVRGAQRAKSEGEAVLLQFSGFTKDPMHDFNRLFCWNSCDCEFWPYIMYLLEYKHEKVHASDDKSLKMNDATLILK